MEKNYFTTAQAAEYMGITLSWMHKLMLAHAIPYYKPGGKLCYFERKDLDEYIAKNRVASREESDEMAEFIARVNNTIL